MIVEKIENFLGLLKLLGEIWVVVEVADFVGTNAREN